MKNKLPLAALASLALSAAPANAAGTLLEVQHWILASEQDASANFDFQVSVNSTNAGFSGSVDKTVEESFGGAIDSYKFFNQASAGVIGSYASSGTRISTPTPLTGTGGSNSSLKLWTTTDPDSTPGTGTPAVDYATTPNFASNTMVQTYAASGSVDLTGLTTGTIYMFYGAYRNTPSFDFTMTGTGQTDVTLLSVGDNDFANNNEFYAYAFSFDTDGGLYDTIDYDFSIPETNNGRGRLGGIVMSNVTAVPEPSTALLGALGALALLRRRR